MKRSDSALPLDLHVIDVLLPDLVGHDRRASSFIVYLYLWRQSGGDGRHSRRISLQTIAADTGLGKRTVQLALTHLQRRRLIEREPDGVTGVPAHRVLRPWRREETA
jgi:hypothetical protein